MMKKRAVILFSCCLLSIFSMQAEIRLGLKAGLNLSEASFSWETLESGNFTGFQAGPVLEVGLPVLGWGLDFGVLYSLQGFKIHEQTERNASLYFPLNLKYKFSLLGAIGFYGSAGLFADVKISKDDFSISDMYDSFKYKTFGAGVNLGFGVELFGKLQVGPSYQIRLTDDYSTDDYTVRTKTWSITAIYFF